MSKALGIQAQVPVAEMNKYAIIHIASRIIYNYLYLNTKSRRFSFLRTIVFQISIYPSIAIFFKAARALN